MADLSDLIARLEAAEGPTEALNRDIARAVNWRHRSGVGVDDWGRVLAWERPDFTGSIDAAMTLVPEGADWSVTNCGERGGPEAVVCYGVPDIEMTDADAATPALALCIAALKARA